MFGSCSHWVNVLFKYGAQIYANAQLATGSLTGDIGDFRLECSKRGVCHKLAVAVWQVQDAAQAAADEMRLGILRLPTVSVGSFAGSAKTCQE